VNFLERPPGFLDTEEHLVSPLHEVLTTGNALFLDGSALRADPRFPIVRDFVRAGATSYLAVPLPTARGDVHVLALWTARPQGWDAYDARRLSRVASLLSLLVELTESRRLLGVLGMAHELTQRAMAEQALRNADALVRQQAVDMTRLEQEREARLQTERQLQERSRDLAERNEALKLLAASLEEKVSERTRDLEDALESAHAATLAKSRFLAMMSHEIRTPMHGVLGLGELLAGTALDDEQRRYVGTMQSTGTALLTLLNGILDFSKIEANRVELEAVPLDPVLLLQDVATLLEGPALENGLHLALKCAEDVPRVVLADPTRLRQVWMNLIGNALKFTEQGGVTVSLRVLERSDTQVRLEGRVQDSGTGIPPEVLELLFEPFAQGDSSTARRFGGTGLGLAICKGLVEQMGGGISVHSRVGEGTTFTFQVTLGLGDRPVIVGTPAVDDQEADLAVLRILVVDDNPVNRLVTERQLVMLGATTPVMAESGAQALALLSSLPFDVVLMDMQMPEMDGLEATRRLRALALGAQPRVIGVTANAYPEDRMACLAAGMDDFLPKPITLRNLGVTIRASAARR
jgi:signal transduction histidine kinase/ActR/RegA family two-component response regulator